MNNRLMALLLSSLLCITCLAACSSGGTDEENTTAVIETGGDYGEIDKYVASLANEASFDGESFTIVGKFGDHCEFEEDTGNLENDALYRRMRELEDTFGIEYKYIMCDGTDYESSPSKEVYAKAQADVMSNSGEYDMIHSNTMVGGQVMLGSGMLQPVEDLPYVDFSRSWWINDIEGQFGIGGHLYFLTGKIVTEHYSDAACVLFNKQIAEEFAITDLYSTVSSGDWTVDRMFETVSVLPDDGSMFRITLGNYEDGLALYFGAGFSIAETDADGNLSIPLSLGNEKTDFIDKVSSFLKDEKLYYVDKRNTGDNPTSAGFSDGEVFLSVSKMGSVSSLRSEDVEFGVIPIPKRDTDQKDYISYATSMGVCSYTVSKVAKDTAKVGLIAEAMAALSEKHLEPAYYDKALKGRGTYDSESREMLDLIYASKKMDYATTYQWGDIWQLIDDSVTSVRDSYTSEYASSSRVANLKIKQLLSKIAADNK